ncbi:MAG: nuclear transport factor 2 family protein [Bacteroidales bacterium]|nr:nuclear transport factor 2 family protein [Bacteroidales bacterium]
MKTTRLSSIVVVIFISLWVNNLNAQDTNVFRQINTQVWEKFEEAFITNNPELLNSLHTDNVLRIPSDSKTIIIGKEYFENQKKSFAWVLENGYKTLMELRFIERISYDNYASERGIFKIIVIEPGDIKQQYFGKFHMILEKKDEAWKISVNYDSTENGTIDELSFKNASDMWDFKPFLTNINE